MTQHSQEYANRDFIAALSKIAPAGSYPVVASFAPPPDKLTEQKMRSAWAGRGFLPDSIAPTTGNTFVTVSAFKPDDRGRVRRNKQSFAGLLAIMIDDIGTKVRLSDVRHFPPSFAVLTSKGNGQYWYLLKEAVTDREFAERLIMAGINRLAPDGKDPGQAGVTRYGRLPVGTNNKTIYSVPFEHKIKIWEPDKRFSVDELVLGLGLTIEPPSVRTTAQIKALKEADLVETAIYEAEIDQDGTEFKIDVDCPWAENHSDGGKDSSGAAYMFPSAENGWIGGFKCHHGHCADKNIGHFVAYLEKVTGRPLRLTEQPSAAEDFGIAGAPDYEVAVKKLDFEPVLVDDCRELKPVEFVVNQFVPTGLTVIAGPAGGGKTTGILPMALNAAWLLGDNDLKPELRRHVVYVTEDSGQVKRILYGLLEDSHVSDAEVETWLHVYDAARLRPKQIAAQIIEWQKEHSYSMGPDFNDYVTGPLIILDTTNATIALDSENDNAEVGHAIGAIKSVLEPSTACWLVSHISKTTSRSDINSMSVRGASAFEGDAQTTVYLVQEDDQRFLMLGKRRFATHVKALALDVFTLDRVVMTPWGTRQDMTVLYTLPRVSDVTPAEIRQEKRQEQKDETVNRIEQDIVAAIKTHGAMSKRKLEDMVPGKGQKKRDIMAQMLLAGQLTSRPFEGGRGEILDLNPDFSADSFDEE